MTLTSLSQRKLHPFFSFQQRNCFQKDGAEPHVIWLHLFIKSANEREHIFMCKGQNLWLRSRKCDQGWIPVGGRGREDPFRVSRLSLQSEGGGTSPSLGLSICRSLTAR